MNHIKNTFKSSLNRYKFTVAIEFVKLHSNQFRNVQAVKKVVSYYMLKQIQT